MGMWIKYFSHQWNAYQEISCEKKIYFQSDAGSWRERNVVNTDADLSSQIMVAF